MFGWGPFPTGPAIGGVFYGPVIEPWIAWALVIGVLAVSCSALWALGEKIRVPHSKTPTRGTDEVAKQAA
jgi:hypothetical protein